MSLSRISGLRADEPGNAAALIATLTAAVLNSIPAEDPNRDRLVAAYAVLLRSRRLRRAPAHWRMDLFQRGAETIARCLIKYSRTRGPWHSYVARAINNDLAKEYNRLCDGERYGVHIDWRVVRAHRREQVAALRQNRPLPLPPATAIDVDRVDLDALPARVAPSSEDIVIAQERLQAEDPTKLAKALEPPAPRVRRTERRADAA